VSGRALDTYLPPVLLDKRLAQVQPDPQPDAGATLHLDPWRPVEPFPDAFVFCWWKSRTLVTHPDLHLLRLFPLLHLYLYGAIFLGIAQGIAQVIGDHVPYPLRIGIHEHWLPRGLTSGLTHENGPLGICLALLFDRRADNRGQINGLSV
jgi:hypothetical protein